MIRLLVIVPLFALVGYTCAPAPTIAPTVPLRVIAPLEAPAVSENCGENTECYVPPPVTTTPPVDNENCGENTDCYVPPSACGENVACPPPVEPPCEENCNPLNEG